MYADSTYFSLIKIYPYISGKIMLSLKYVEVT